VESGVVLYFSANDGRADPGDFTGVMWSNTPSATEP
jgi:hypothetical protein